jgi:hypothetical protein
MSDLHYILLCEMISLGLFTLECIVVLDSDEWFDVYATVAQGNGNINIPPGPSETNA